MIDKDTFANRTALFHTFGCKLNFAETSTVARIFASKGIQRVHEGDVPDYIVVNTCSVTEIADKKCRQAIRSFARRYPEAKFEVTAPERIENSALLTILMSLSERRTTMQAFRMGHRRHM